MYPHAASGWRIHCGVEVTELSTNKQHSLWNYSTSPEVQTDAKPRVVKNQRTPNKAGSGSLSMERAQRGVKRAQPDTPAPSLERGQRKGRGVNTSRDVGGTAQTPASGRATCAVPTSVGGGCGRNPYGSNPPQRHSRGSGRPAQPRAAHLF